MRRSRQRNTMRYLIGVATGLLALAATLLLVPSQSAVAQEDSSQQDDRSQATPEPVSVVIIDLEPPEESYPPQPTPPVPPKPAASDDPAAAQRLTFMLDAAAAGLGNYRKPNHMRQSDIDEILSTLPDNLPLGRRLIVVKAYSLLGKVPYDWGGKSSALGWDFRWGTPKIVVRNGVRTQSEDLVGLDCSGFVRWCFLNAAGTKALGKRLGSGTYRQWLNSREIPLEQAQPGDLLFTNAVGKTNHNGIVVQNLGNGNLLVIHCAEGKGVVLENAKTSGFRFARRPDVLSGENLDSFEASARRHINADQMADLRYLVAWAEWTVKSSGEGPGG